jgi:hypothetical protein
MAEKSRKWRQETSTFTTRDELNMTTFSLLLLDDIYSTIYSYFRRIEIMKIR